MQQLLVPLIMPLPGTVDHQTASWTQLHALPHLQHFTLESPDVIWINTAGESLGIEEVRSLQELLGFGAYQSQGRLVVILHADTASIPAQNALLKLLEEPPAQTQLVLTATQPDSFLPTVLSRCRVLSHVLDMGASEGTSSQPLPELLQRLITSPAAVHYHEVLAFADGFAERADAIATLEQLVISTHLQLSSPSAATTAAPHHSSQIAIILEGLSWLKSNAHVKLAVGECLFRLKRVDHP